MFESKTNRIAIYISAFIVVSLILFAVLRDNSEPITLSQATTILQDKAVEKVIVTKEYVYLKTNKDNYRIASSQVTPKMFSEYQVEIGTGSNFIVYLLFFLLFLGIASIIYKFLEKKGNFLKPAPTTQTPYDNSSGVIEATKSDVTFSDIGGISDVKIELEEIIDFMKNPKRYKNFGARMPRGVLLVGPPGVGKTMIAKAVANAANVPFYYQSGASFVQIYVGMGAKRVHELFSAAKRNAPSIIFIDEIDAVGKARDGQRNDEREATLNQLLTEMDGFEGSSGVIVVAATNKIEVLDAALLRAGRFDRRIFVELPTKREREAILLKYLAKIPHNIDIKLVANMTVGFNGASLATLVNEAALLALRQNDFQVTLEHFSQVKDKVIFGKRKLAVLNEEQKKFKVTYQAGKVICATYFNLPFEKILLSNEKLTPTVTEPLLKKEVESRIKMLLAGMVACTVAFNEHSSDAKNDLDEAKELAQKMCQEYGMGSSLLSKEGDVREILTKLQDETKMLLVSLKSVMAKVEQVLFERESISKEEVRKYINEVL